MSEAVTAVDGIKYGFRLLGYFMAVAILGSIVAFVGTALAGASTGGLYQDPNPLMALMGFGLTLFGVAIVYAGILGTGYKVIADAVYLGNVTANGGTGGAGTTRTDGGERER